MVRLLMPLDALARRRGQLFGFAPVCLAVGTGVWFALPRDPSAAAYALVALGAAPLLALRLRGAERLHLPVLALLLVLTGFLVAGARANLVAAPVLTFRYYGPIEGRVVMIDRSFSDQIRVTLDRVVLSRVDPERTPARVRVALHGAQPVTPLPGQRLMMTGFLAPPDGPVAPGGFDFQRLAWFSRLGAVGYTRTPALVRSPPDGEITLAMFGLRMRLSAAMQAAIGGQPGALAAALMTGDRSALDATTNEVMRASNLSHLLSISGLHMGLLSGFVFAALRYGLALIPPLALRLDTRKLAAGAGLVAATFYLGLAGSNAATDRSWMMVAVMLVAVMLNRRAISLRSVAIAAFVLLAMEPEGLVEPGFQMSFAATVALVAGFEAARGGMRRLPPWSRPLAVAVLSSLVAGAATTPFAAAHFNRIAGYGLVANLAVTPVMAMAVMPAGVLAAVLAPLGLAALPLWVMGRGTALVLWVAQTVSGWQGAVMSVAAPGPFVLPLLALGGVWLVLWPGRARWAGLLAMGVALVAWQAAERPALLIAADGGLVGLAGPQGRALSREKGAGFVASSWLEDDGDVADQAAAFARPGFSGPKGRRSFVLTGPDGRRLPGLHLTGKAAPGLARAACARPGLVIVQGRVDMQAQVPAATAVPAAEKMPAPAAAQMPAPAAGQMPAPKVSPLRCMLVDEQSLRRTGALSIVGTDGGLRVITARAVAGDRLWNRRDPPGEGIPATQVGLPAPNE